MMAKWYEEVERLGRRDRSGAPGNGRQGHLSDALKKGLPSESAPLDEYSLTGREGTQTPPEAEVPFVPQPGNLRELGVSLDLVTSLALKELYFSGKISAMDLSQALAIPFSITQDTLDSIKQEQLASVVGSQGPMEQFYEYCLTNLGRERANEALLENRYRGPVPVPFVQYCKVVKEQSSRSCSISPKILADVLQHLVLDDKVIHQLGAATNSSRPILLYGPPGNGKTTIALSLVKLLEGPILVPHAVDVGGNIIKVFDPAIHQVVADDNTNEGSWEAPSEEHVGPPPRRRYRRDYPADNPYEYQRYAVPQRLRDQRWTKCARPTVVAGGELTLEGLEMHYDRQLGYHSAPPQMKASGGLLLIDDLGRQRTEPQELLNRLIVPMDRGVDYLMLSTGATIELPFQVMLVFSTNLSLSKVLDEAGLRRLGYKLLIPDPTEDEFHAIFYRAAAAKGIAVEAELLDYLIDLHYRKADRRMRGCHPLDLLTRVEDISCFRGKPPQLSREIIDLAVDSLFVTD